MSQTTAAERLMSTAQVAAWIGVSENTLRFWRWDKRGPKWFRLGRIVKYRLTDVQSWMDEQYASVNGEPPNHGSAA